MVNSFPIKVPGPFVGKELSLQQFVLGQLNIHIQDKELDPYLTPYTKLIQNVLKT